MSAVVINGLTKQYADTTALHGIELSIPEGAFFGLLGPNGAGKTTTINILAGLCTKSAGAVSIFGHDIVADYRACRRLVGLVPQDFNFDVFVRLKKMLMFQGGYFGIERAECERRADALLAEFDLTEKGRDQLRHLSGGMKRRAIIARALMHRPKVLILDEPTAGVDVELRQSLWSYLRQLNENGTTILLTTHYIEEAEALCDRIAIINDGRIVTTDSTENLLNRLSQESIHVTFVDRATTVSLSHLPGVTTAASPDGAGVTVIFDREKTDYHAVLESIIASGNRIRNIRPVGNRLEQVFLGLTARSGQHE